MATFTSNGTGGGDFNADATWTAGSGYPGAGDNFVITAGDTVTYNLDTADELGGGDMTLSGLLTFSITMDTKMVIATGKRIVINNGGELRIGASGAVVDDAYTAELYFNESSDDSDAMLINAGGKLTMYGDPVYYGSDGETTLADNAENTDGDAIIKTADNMSALWNVGDEICIHIKNSYSAYNTDVILRTISSFDGGDGTLITVTGGNVTTNSGCVGKVINVSRNVKFGKLSAVTTIGQYNSNRPGIDDNNTVGGNVNISNVLIEGIYRYDGGVSSVFTDVTIRNSYYGVYAGTGHTISGNVYSNNIGVAYGTGHTISGNVYSNTYGVYGTDIIITGKLGYNAGDVSSPNTSDFRFNGWNYFICRNCKMPLAGITIYSSSLNADRTFGQVKCEHYDRKINDNRTYDVFGNILKVAADGTGDAPSVDPDGGNGDVVELSTIQSNCNSDNPLKAFEHYVWATASESKTYTYKIQTTYAGIAEGGIKLTGSYLDEGSGGHLAEETDDSAIAQRTGETPDADWTQTLAVTINPAQTGWVRLKIELMEYESGNEVWIYPKPTIS